MANYNILNWQNENALSGFPFSLDIDPPAFIVDARFVQFDNHVPVLNTIAVQPTFITLTITFDHGINSTGVFTKAEYDRGEDHRHLHIYTPGGDRYLGVVTFGSGIVDVWDSYVGRKLQPNASFMASTVFSIPRGDAVYTFDGNYGDVELSRTLYDTAIFYNSSEELNAVVFNAVGGHAVPEGQVPLGLKQINYVKPINNNITLASNDVIKITPVNAAALSIDLVSGSSSSAFTLPTLTV